MRLGHGQRRSVLILWMWTVLLSAMLRYPPYTSGSGDLYVPIGIAAAALVLYSLFAPCLRTPQADDRLAVGNVGRSALVTKAHGWRRDVLCVVFTRVAILRRV